MVVPQKGHEHVLTSRLVRLGAPLCAARLEAVDERACTLAEPGELGRTLGGGPGSAPGERRSRYPRWCEELDEGCMAVVVTLFSSEHDLRF